MRVLSLDPGQTTGWAWADLEPGLPDVGRLLSKQLVPNIQYGQFVGRRTSETVDAIMKTVEMIRPDAIVTEDFILRPFQRGGTTDPKGIEPARVNAVLEDRLEQEAWFILLYLQSANDAKSIVTDDRLRSWGLWVKGQPHARDAIRHLVVFFRKKKD